MARTVAAAVVFICLLNDVFISSSSGARFKTSIDHCIPDPESLSIGDRASCTFTRVVDVDPNRFPTRIPTVRCKCPGVLCSPLGDFRCREVKEFLQVARRRSNGSFRNETMQVTVSCVCALSRGQASDSGSIRIVNHTPNGQPEGIPVR